MTSSDGVVTVILTWSPIDNLVNDYNTVFINPPIESGSTFITTKTSIRFLFKCYQEYNVSVVASNCIGNSTPAETIIGSK